MRPGELLGVLVQALELPQQNGMGLEQRRCDQLQSGVTGHELANAFSKRALGRPTFRPKPRSTPRRLFSMSRSLDCSSLRAVGTARVARAVTDLQCTGRNQPSRINCAILRASLRSVFTGTGKPRHRATSCRIVHSSRHSTAASGPILADGRVT